MLGTYEITTDKKRIDLHFVHGYLTNRSYWAHGRTLPDVKLSIANSLCFSLFLMDNKEQIGFARVVTDYVVFAWIMDVFIKDEYRGMGCGGKLVDHILGHPGLKKVKGLGLRTHDAHGLYHQFGFTEVPHPGTWMFKKNTK